MDFTLRLAVASRGLRPGSVSSRYPGRVGGLYMSPDRREGCL